MATNQDRLVPQDIEAEQSVIGSILIHKDSFFKIGDLINADDFYLDAHKKIYQTIAELSEDRKPVDILSVSSKLKEKKLLEKVGGQSVLTSLVNSVPSASHIVHYAEIVHKKSVLRKLIDASHHIAQLGYREEDETELILDEAEQKVFQIANRINTKNISHIKEGLTETFERYDKLYNDDGTMRGVPTGFTDLDNMLSGMQKGDLVILAARPSLGKSALALNIAKNVATKHNIPVGVFSLEMSRDQIIDRMIAAHKGINLWNLRTGKFSKENFEKINQAMDDLSKAPIFIDDGASFSALQIRAMARRLQAEHGLELLIVDYLQLIQPRAASDNLVQQITEISRSLKALARELKIPVLALSQLSRAAAQSNERPKLHHLRDSGSIEQDADVVMFIHRDLNTEDSDSENVAEINIAKHRNGPIGKVNLRFSNKFASFENLEKHRGQDVPPPPDPPEGE